MEAPKITEDWDAGQRLPQRPQWQKNGIFSLSHAKRVVAAQTPKIPTALQRVPSESNSAEEGGRFICWGWARRRSRGGMINNRWVSEAISDQAR